MTTAERRRVILDFLRDFQEYRQARLGAINGSDE